MAKSISELYDEMKGIKRAPAPTTKAAIPASAIDSLPKSIDHTNDPIVAMFLESRGLLEKKTDAQQNKVKLGVKTPVDLEPTTKDETPADSQPVKPKKKPVVQEGIFGSLVKAAVVDVGKAVVGTVGHLGQEALGTGSSHESGHSHFVTTLRKLRAMHKFRKEAEKRRVDDMSRQGKVKPPTETKKKKGKPEEQPRTVLSPVDTKSLMDEFKPFQEALGDFFYNSQHPIKKVKPEDWKDNYDAALKHHNIGVEAHNSGDLSKARVHFRTRDKHMIRFARTAPVDQIKKLNLNQIKALEKITEAAKALGKKKVTEAKEINPQIKYGGEWQDSVNHITNMGLDIGTLETKHRQAMGPHREGLAKLIKIAKAHRDMAIEVHKKKFPIKESHEPFITGMSGDLTMVDDSGKKSKLPRYGVWKHDPARGKHQVVDTGDDLEALKKKHGVTQVHMMKEDANTLMEGQMKAWLMGMQDHVHELSARHKGDKTKAKADFLKKYPGQDRVFNDTFPTTSGDYPIPGWKPAKLKEVKAIGTKVLSESRYFEDEEIDIVLDRYALFGFYPAGPWLPPEVRAKIENDK